ncbi:MAG: hypothetical protein QGG36_18055 [Pirellulaceae bacterium]|jgi:hypothetical protein|nr:hypothetical protein [Pirellulaceae bacterium]
MPSSKTTEVVRQRVEDYLRSRGATADDHLEETILIRDGFYCGRRFTVGELQAVWFVEEDQLKVFDADGALAEVIEKISAIDNLRSNAA